MDTMRTCLVLLCASALSTAANAGEIVRWVDADGVVHFGDRHAAPSRGAQTVEVRPANGMDVAKTPDTGTNATGLSVTRLDRSSLENKRGWRGYDARPKRRTAVRVRR